MLLRGDKSCCLACYFVRTQHPNSVSSMCSVKIPKWVFSPQYFSLQVWTRCVHHRIPSTPAKECRSLENCLSDYCQWDWLRDSSIQHRWGCDCLALTVSFKVVDEAYHEWAKLCCTACYLDLIHSKHMTFQTDQYHWRARRERCMLALLRFWHCAWYCCTANMWQPVRLQHVKLSFLRTICVQRTVLTVINFSMTIMPVLQKNPKQQHYVAICTTKHRSGSGPFPYA